MITDVHSAVAEIVARHDASATPDFLADMLTVRFPGKIALVSSFGTEAAVLLSMVAEIAPATPVLFIDTGKHFGETLRYRDTLVRRLGLTDVRNVSWTPEEEAEGDPKGTLFARDYDACCFMRKVRPLARALEPFEAWINGRKGHHGGARAAMPVAEADGGRVKLTPLARWTAEDVDAVFEARNLPRHPLEEDGYRSVGCYTCSMRTEAGGDARSGRWAGSDKIECGIHTMLPTAAAQ